MNEQNNHIKPDEIAGLPHPHGQNKKGKTKVDEEAHSFLINESELILKMFSFRVFSSCPDQLEIPLNVSSKHIIRGKKNMLMVK